MGIVHHLGLRARGSLHAPLRLSPAIFAIAGILAITAVMESRLSLRSPHGKTVPARVQSTDTFAKVIDGDTLHTGNVRIRLIGLDAPESAQTCRDSGAKEWSCGQAAKTRLAELMSEGTVVCTPHGHDRYGRVLAICAAGSVPDVGEVLVREGYAVNYSFDGKGYAAAEEEARANRRGIWQGRFESPQNWRHRHPYHAREREGPDRPKQ